MKFRRRHVVQHGEGGGPSEPVIWKLQCSGVALDNFHSGGAGKSVPEQFHQLGVDFDGRQAWRQLAQHVRGRSVTGADLEDFVAEILVAQGPGQDLLANVEPPFIAAAHLVVLVHPFSMSPSPCPPGQRSIRLGRHLWFDNQSCWADQGLTAGALPCFAQRTVSRSSSARRAALRRTCRPGAPGTLSQAGRGWPGATVRARMPRVALSACSEMTGKIPESFHCCSTDDQSQ